MAPDGNVKAGEGLPTNMTREDDSSKPSDRLRKSKSRSGRSVNGDEAKFLSYTEAWARIRAARKNGFFLEAVTIQESIISDRLTSFVVKNCGVDSTAKSLRTLHNLIGTWIKLTAEHLPASAPSRQEVEELQLRLNRWRDDRNDVVHGLVKSRPSRAGDHIEDFLARAAAAAQEGEALARQVSRWVDVARREMDTIVKKSAFEPTNQ